MSSFSDSQSDSQPAPADGPDDLRALLRQVFGARRLSALGAACAPDLALRMPLGLVVGAEAVQAAAQSALAVEPRADLLEEDALWHAPDQGGLVSSLRMIVPERRAPEGRCRPKLRLMADVFAEQTQLREIWLVPELGALPRHLGQPLADWCRARIARLGGAEACPRPLAPQAALTGPYRGIGPGETWGQSLSFLFQRLMRADFGALPDLYDRACAGHYAGLGTGHGPEGAERFWLPLRAALPDGTAQVHHAMGRNDPGQPPRAALRWSLSGRHAGAGAFGPPSGAEIHVLGITHVEFGPRGIRREWTVIDETAVWTQILLATGACDIG